MNRELISLARKVDDRYSAIESENALNQADTHELYKALTDRYSFKDAKSIHDITGDVDRMLSLWTLQTNHPRHFGLYQPGMTSTGVIADALAAAHNPQLGAWWFSPAANEIEKHCLSFISRKFGYSRTGTFSCFTSGGSESTTTAVLCALTRQFPDCGHQGLAGLKKQPRIYVSQEAHDSIFKIAHQLGIGRQGVTTVKTDPGQKMDIGELRNIVKADRKNGYQPFLVLATAGTTAGGAIDPLPGLADFCGENNLWLHVDAAWGGGFVFSDSAKPYLSGIDAADSVTWDPHKSLPIPTGAGVFLCRHLDAVKKAFHVDTAYVPDEVDENPDLYRYGIQWSRRFIGLKVFMTIAELGEKQLAAMLDHQVDMGKFFMHHLMYKIASRPFSINHKI